MKYYLAPLEGLTGYIYRRAHAEFFPGTDRYFTPFIVPGLKDLRRSRDVRDVLPENNAGIPLVPQILSNRAEDFLNTAGSLFELGYGEVNLNLGCPSGTVVSKGRGSGFLADTEGLDRFFDAVFSACPAEISVKTRIGLESAENWPAIMEIFNRYPLSELIVHPRLQKQKYGGTPDPEAFAYALAESKAPICYNGDLFTPEDIARFQSRFPAVERLMLGRGLIADPALVRKAQGGKSCEKEELRAFHDRLLGDYLDLRLGDKNTLYRMKELWGYMGSLFPGSEKAIKAINKSQKLADYLMAVNGLFSRFDAAPDSIFGKRQ